MSEIPNSKRSIERATYTPIKKDPKQQNPPKRTWDKWSYIALLAPRLDELSKIERSHQPELISVTKVIREALLKSTSFGHEYLDFDSVPYFANLSVDSIVLFSNALIEQRKKRLTDAAHSYSRIFEAYQKQGPKIQKTDTSNSNLNRNNSSDILNISSQKWVNMGDFIHPNLPLTVHYIRESTIKTDQSHPPENQRAKTSTATSDEKKIIEAVLVPKENLKSIDTQTRQTTLPHSPAPSLDELLQWAVHNQMNDVDILELKDVIQLKDFKFQNFKLTELNSLLELSLNSLELLKIAFQERMKIEPVGFLHLEKLTFTPESIEKGELIYSVPLSPAEEVNITHKEWSNTSEEFSKIVTDYIEEYSEEGVTEKSELAQSTHSQDQHSSGFNTGVTASGGYGPVTLTASVGYNISDSSSHSEQSARNQSSSLTRKASSRAKKEHKQSFKVASARGTSDESIRKIRNPFTDKATRIDYFQLVRKWQVRLYRYGVRLTYDFTIPEPGSDILTKIIEANSIRSALEEGFNSPTSVSEWSKFDLAPNLITRENYMSLSTQYNTAIDIPPEEFKSIVRSFSKTWPNKDAAGSDEFTTFKIEVPEGYLITGFAYSSQFWKWDKEPWHFDIASDPNAWLGKDGQVDFVIGTKYVSAFNFDFRIDFTLKKETFEAWQMKSWSALRTAAESKYQENRTYLKDKLSQLQLEIGSQDPLSLRKIEREEVMKGVLRWLFGPSFAFVPPGLPQDLYNTNEAIMNKSIWARVLRHGEMIQFLHHAIEWENMLYFLYPYFWSHTSRWELKKYLDHPDKMHTIFLKSGSARVVLTIRPGFEKEFISFLETGKIDGLSEGHPYLTIAEELSNFAKTNYPGLAPANPVESTRPLLTPEQKRAWTEMQEIMKLLELYKTKNGRYPTTLEGLKSLESLGKFSTTDPWKNPYQYLSPGKIQEYELWSFGADGKEGGTGIDSDIQSWAESSLIGQWYEYTPTSALDISFNEILPSA